MPYLASSAWSAIFAGRSTWPADVVLLRQGEIPTTVYVVDHGAIKLVHGNSEGEEHVLEIRRAPALVGAAFAVADRASLVDVVTLMPSTLRWCSTPAFLAAALADERGSELQRLYCTEIVKLFERAAAMSIKSATARLDEFFARNGNDLAGLGIRQSLIASFLNVTPEHLSRLVKKKMAKAKMDVTDVSDTVDVSR